MKPTLRGVARVLLAVAGLAAAALLPTACAPSSDQKIASGKVLDRNTVFITFLSEGVPPISIELSSTAYAEVNEQCLPWLVDQFRASLSRDGIPVSDLTGATGYDQRFQCTGFSDYFAGKAAALLMGQLWHSRMPVQRPAVFTAWYTPDNGPKDELGRKIGHAINPIITPNGVVYLEPQNGTRLKLSPAERLSMRTRA